MAAKLQETNDEIKQKTEELAARTQQLDAQVAALHTYAPPAPPPGIANTNELIGFNMNKLSTVVDDLSIKIGILEKNVVQQGSRSDTLEMNAKFSSGSIQEMQGSLTATRIEIQQLVAQVLSSSVGSVANVGAYGSGPAAGGASTGVSDGIGASAAHSVPDPWYGQ